MNGSRILLIGGAGYIGSHLLSPLLESGREVTVLGRRSFPVFPMPEDVHYVNGDFSDARLLKQLLDQHQEVIHLAYATVPNTSYENPLADLLQNLPPTIQLFNEVAKRGVKLLLVSSGGTVYGNPTVLPITEQHSTKPISPYGLTKLTLENYAYLYAATHGLKFVCVRPANAYGPGQRPFSGQGFIATAMASVMQGAPIKVFGKTGTIRDYLYVSDIASGLISALNHGELSQTYNLGSGYGLSNVEVIEVIRNTLNLSTEEIFLESMPERSFDVKANVLDSTKLMHYTHWYPKVEFHQGLLNTYEWLKDYQ